jgi:hypothetical protein
MALGKPVAVVGSGSMMMNTTLLLLLLLLLLYLLSPPSSNQTQQLNPPREEKRRKKKEKKKKKRYHRIRVSSPSPPTSPPLLFLPPLPKDRCSDRHTQERHPKRNEPNRLIPALWVHRIVRGGLVIHCPCIIQDYVRKTDKVLVQSILTRNILQSTHRPAASSRLVGACRSNLPIR